MKTLAALLLAPLLLSTSAFAGVQWVGNIKIKETRRGSRYETEYRGEPIEINLCDYGVFNIQLEVYKPGVTDTNSPAWQNINASMRTVQEDNGKVIREGRPNVVGRRGNNAVYDLDISTVAPSAVTGLDPASQKASLEISFDGQEALSIPLNFSCRN
jgi:hypothetical protein